MHGEATVCIYLNHSMGTTKNLLFPSKYCLPNFGCSSIESVHMDYYIWEHMISEMTNYNKLDDVKNVENGEKSVPWNGSQR